MSTTKKKMAGKSVKTVGHQQNSSRCKNANDRQRRTVKRLERQSMKRDIANGLLDTLAR